MQARFAAAVSWPRCVRFGQALGMSLNEVAAINAEREQRRMTPKRGLEIMTDQPVELQAKTAEFAVLADYLQANISRSGAAHADGGHSRGKPALAINTRPSRGAVRALHLRQARRRILRGNSRAGDPAPPAGARQDAGLRAADDRNSRR